MELLFSLHPLHIDLHHSLFFPAPCRQINPFTAPLTKPVPLLIRSWPSELPPQLSLAVSVPFFRTTLDDAIAQKPRFFFFFTIYQFWESEEFSFLENIILQFFMNVVDYIFTISVRYKYRKNLLTFYSTSLINPNKAFSVNIRKNGKMFML